MNLYDESDLSLSDDEYLSCRKVAETKWPRRSYECEKIISNLSQEFVTSVSISGYSDKLDVDQEGIGDYMKTHEEREKIFWKDSDAKLEGDSYDYESSVSSDSYDGDESSEEDSDGSSTGCYSDDDCSVPELFNPLEEENKGSDSTSNLPKPFLDNWLKKQARKSRKLPQLYWSHAKELALPSGMKRIEPETSPAAVVAIEGPILEHMERFVTIRRRHEFDPVLLRNDERLIGLENSIPGFEVPSNPQNPPPRCARNLMDAFNGVQDFVETPLGVTSHN